MFRTISSTMRSRATRNIMFNSVSTPASHFGLTTSITRFSSMATNPNIAAAEQQAKRVYGVEKLFDAPRAAAGQAVGVKVSVVSSVPEDSAFTVYFVTEKQVKSADFIKSLPVNAEVAQSIIDAQNYKAGAKSVIVLPGKSGKVILAGLGDVVDGISSTAAAACLDDVRQAAHCALEAVRGQKPEAVTFVAPTIPVTEAFKVIPGFGKGVKDATKEDKTEEKPATAVSTVAGVSAERVTGVIARTVVASNHAFDKYLKELTHLVSTFTIVGSISESALQHEVISAEATIVARELGNDRADIIHPQSMRDLAERFAKTHSDIFSIRVVDYDELLSLGFNLITNVGRGAVHKPSVICLEYKNSTSAAAPLAIVGKTLTFDSGGMHIKPGTSMDTMYMDMCGGAAVMGTMFYLAHARPVAHVIGTLAIAENATGPDSYKPMVIMNSYAGTVQNGNCDAEGRLALADAMVFTQQTYAPSKIVDMATLTGVQALCFSDGASAVFSNSDGLRKEIQDAGAKVNELNWPMPILPQHHADLKVPQADLSSTGVSRTAGASTAAAFLENFVFPGTEWAHVDIAGPASANAARGNIPKGATGFGVQTFIELILKQ